MKAYRLALLLFPLLLGACSIIPATEPVDVYLLPGAARAANQAASPLAISLRVTRPVAATRLAGTRIAVLPRDNQFSVYQGARWSDPAPLLLRDRLLDAFVHDGRIAALSSDAQSARADYQLDSELLAFQTEYRDGAPHVVVRLDAMLVKTATRNIVARRRFEIDMPVAGKALPEAVQAFGKASDALVDQVAAWSINQIGAGA